MTRRSRSPILAALLVVVLVGTLAVGTAVADTPTPTPSNETANESVAVVAEADGDDDSGPYDLEQLRHGGQLPSNAPASVRPMGSTGQLWVQHAPTGFMRADEPDQWENLEPQTTVRRGHVYLRSSRAWDAEPETVNLTVTYWSEGEITRSDGEQTVRERAAVDQVVEEHTLELGAGYDVNQIDLRRPPEGETREVTMWVEGHEQEIQWRLEREASPAGTAVGISTRGDAVMWGLLWLFLPGGLTAVGIVWLDRKILERAGAGPQYKVSEYVGLAFFGAFVGALFAYEWVIDTISAAPWALGVASGLGLGLIVIELFGDRTYKDLFVRFDLRDAETREDGSGIMKAEVSEKKLVDLEDGSTGVVEEGLRAFIERARGAVPRLDTGPLQRETQIDVEGSWRRLHLVDPTADDALDYEPAGWELGVLEEPTPSEREGLVGLLEERLSAVDWLPVLLGLGVVYLGYGLSIEVFGTGVIGTLVAGLVVLMWWARPVAGEAHAALAPAHFDSVIANMLSIAEGLEETADREFYKSRYHEEKGKNLADRKVEREETESSRMESVMDRLVPEQDDESVLSGDGTPERGEADD